MTTELNVTMEGCQLIYWNKSSLYEEVLQKMDQSLFTIKNIQTLVKIQNV